MIEGNTFPRQVYSELHELHMWYILEKTSINPRSIDSDSALGGRDFQKSSATV